MHFTTLPVLIICFCRAFKLRKLRARKIAHAKGWFRICLNIFLNSQFNASIVLRQIVRRIIRMNVSDTRKLDQTNGACQSWSCSMEYFPFFYVYERHLWIMRSMSLAYRRRWLRWPKAKDRLRWCFRVGFRFRFFSSKSPHHSVNLNFDRSKIKRSTEKSQLESRHYPSNLNFALPNSSGRTPPDGKPCFVKLSQHNLIIGKAIIYLL